MTKITRRHAVVELHHGNFEQDLADKQAEFEAALASEETGQRRATTRSKAARIAQEWEALKAEAKETAVKVTVWAISNTEWSVLADEHPPRDDEPGDKARGLNMKTFPAALLVSSLVEPGTQGNGKAILDTLDLSRIHYAKLETAAWNVNVGDDALPKYSLASMLKQARDPDSKPSSDTE